VYLWQLAPSVLCGFGKFRNKWAPLCSHTQAHKYQFVPCENLIIMRKRLRRVLTHSRGTHAQKRRVLSLRERATLILIICVSEKYIISVAFFERSASVFN
jgi:hypothetical protein